MLKRFRVVLALLVLLPLVPIALLAYVFKGLARVCETLDDFLYWLTCGSSPTGKPFHRLSHWLAGIR